MRNTLTILMVLIGLHVFGQGVGINTTTPHPSAVLDVTSATQGLLAPRMTDAQRDAISNPAVGLQIYNTDTDCLNIYTGAGWKQVCPDCILAAPAVGNDGPVCQGGTINLSAPMVSGATYQWSGPNGFSSTQQNPIRTDMSPSDTGTYYLTITVSACTSPAGSTSVTLSPPPATVVAANNGPVCTGSSLNLTATTFSGATYEWTGPNAFSSSDQNPTIGSITAAGAGDYIVNVRLSGGCYTVPDTTMVSVDTVVSGTQIFTYTGNNQTFNVPNQSCLSSISVKMWGGGGGGGSRAPISAFDAAPGGGGGYSEALLAVTPGDGLTVVVGGGGASDNSGNIAAGGFPNGGNGHGGGNKSGGGGGGHSAIFDGSTPLIIAGGGGGGCSVNGNGYGGAGGGTTGENGQQGNGASTPGLGGAQSSGGSAGGGGTTPPTAGSYLQGGNGGGEDGAGGAGGGGYYGGGGGGGNGSGGSGGGGGSGFVPVGGSTLQGLSTTPANAADSDRNGAGEGGAQRTGGTSGRVIISW